MAAQQPDCTQFDFLYELEGFDDNCGPAGSPGTFCVLTQTEQAIPFTCNNNYWFELEFPTSNFIYTDLGDWATFPLGEGQGDNPDIDGNTVLRTDAVVTTTPEAYRICLEGVIQVPNTVFTLRIVRKDDRTDVFSEITLQFDGQARVVGTPGTTTLLSTLIGNGDLLTLAQTSTMGQNVLVRGELVIDQNYSFSQPYGTNRVATRVTMAKDASMSVEPNVTLFTGDIFVTGCGGDRWERILVKTGATYSVSNTKIMDAITAIELQDQSVLNAFRGRFRDNLTAIGSYGSARKDITINLFAVNGPAISVQDGTSGLRFENVNLADLSSYINLKNLTTGIYLDGSSMISDDLISVDVEFTVEVRNDCQMVDVHEAYSEGGTIWMRVLGTARELTVEDCTIRPSLTGIAMLGMSGAVATIRHNTIEEARFGIGGTVQTSSGRVFANGIDVDLIATLFSGAGPGNHRWAVQDNQLFTGVNEFQGRTAFINNMNDFRFFRNDAVDSYLSNVEVRGGERVYIGYNENMVSNAAANILVRDCRIPFVYCNELDDGNLTSIQMEDNCFGGVIRGNEMSDADENIVYGQPNRPFTLVGEQPFRGNEFDLSTPANPKAVDFNTMSVFAVQNIYEVDASNIGTTYYPYFTSVISDWFRQESGFNYTCPPGLLPDQLDTTTIDRGIELAINNLSNLATAKGTHERLDAEISILRLTESVSYSGSGGYGTVISALQSAPVGQYVALEQQVDDIVGAIDYQAAWPVGLTPLPLGDLTDTIWKFKAARWDSLAQQYTFTTQDSTDFQTLRSELATETENYRVAAGQVRSQRLTQAGNLRSSLQQLSIPAGDTLLDHYRDLTLANLDFWEFGEITKSTLPKIEMLSKECPYTLGNIVYEARSLQALETQDLESLVYDDSSCGGDKTTGQQPVAVSTFSEVTVYPNPASSQLTIDLAGYGTGRETKVDCYLTDLNGRRLIERRVAGGGQRNLSIRKLPAGVYVLHLVARDGTTLLTEKIVKQ